MIEKILFAEQALALCHGNLYEPRLLYATLRLTTTGAGLFGAFNPAAFRNGEQFPLHVTHLLFAIRQYGGGDDPAAGTSETLAQRIGLRCTEYSSYYMTDTYTPLPCWGNVPVGLGDPYGLSMSVWNFMRPILLPFRSSLYCYSYLENTPAAESFRRVSVSFHGQRDVSRQAAELPAFIDQDTAVDIERRITPADNYSNDGSEAIAVEGMTINVDGESDDLTNVGDIRQARIRFGMSGGGANTDFTRTSVLNPTNGDRGCPAVLFGVSGGRAIVHRIPRGGWILHPGHGFQVEANYLQPVSSVDVCMAAAGYLVMP